MPLGLDVPVRVRRLRDGRVPELALNPAPRWSPQAQRLDAMGDGVLTVGELESLPSLIIGRATKYQFIQLNSGRVNSHPTMRDGQTQTVAHGLLEDGREFLFNRTTEANEITSVKIDFK